MRGCNVLVMIILLICSKLKEKVIVLESFLDAFSVKILVYVHFSSDFGYSFICNNLRQSLLIFNENSKEFWS